MTWDRAIELAQIATGIGAVLAALVAVWVAFYVSSREDGRQREAERRALQRQYVIELQEAWLTLDRMQAETIEKIQRHQSATQNLRDERKANFDARKRGEEPASQAQVDARWQAHLDRSEESANTGDEMIAAILKRRAFAQHVELLESRIVSNDVKRFSLAMRVAVEQMELRVANIDSHAHYNLKETVYGPGFQAFIDATYDVLADLKPYPPETDETRRLRREATRIASNRPWVVAADSSAGESEST